MKARVVLAGALIAVLFAGCNVPPPVPGTPPPGTPPPGTPPPPGTADRCRDAHYVHAFDPRLRPEPCVVVETLVLHNAHTRREGFSVPVLRLTSMTRNTADAVRDLRTLAANVAGAADAIGLSLPDKLTLLLDDLPPLAETRAARWPQRDPTECTVAYSFTSTDPRKLFIAAHDIFHCMQAKQWDDAHLERSDVDWWVEGSAELFGDMVYPGLGFTDLDAATFNARESMPLTDRAHDAVVFFDWFLAMKGAGELVALLDGVHDQSGSGALHELAGAVPLTDWVSFQEAYYDHRIMSPGGRVVPYPDTPTPPTTRIDSSGTKTFAAEPFVIRRAMIEFARDKQYQVDRAGQAPEIATKWSPALPWADPPPLVVTCDGPKKFRVVTGTVTSSLTVPVRITANEARDCNCIVGQWQQTPASLARVAARMQARGIRGATCSITGGGTLLDVRADHTGADTYQSFTYTCNGTTMQSTGTSNGALSFTWATSGSDQLDITGTGSTAKTHIHTVVHGRAVDQDVAVPSASQRARYVCSGNQLHIEYLGTGTPDPYDYTRVGGPAHP